MQQITALLTDFPACTQVEQEIGKWEAAVLLWSLGHIGLERKKEEKK